MSTVAERETPKVSVAQAASAAQDYFRSLFGNLTKFSLEETELSEDGRFWMITLGHEVPKDRLEAPSFFAPPQTKFKIFKVDSQTGEVLSMKVRSVE